MNGNTSVRPSLFTRFLFIKLIFVCFSGGHSTGIKGLIASRKEEIETGQKEVGQSRLLRDIFG